jgi:hypothetical protein
MAYKVKKKKIIEKKQKRLTIYDIKRLTSDTEPYFFSPKTMKFFGQRLSDYKVYKRKDGKYDIIAPSYWNGKLMGYTKRTFNPKTRRLELVEK